MQTLQVHSHVHIQTYIASVKTPFSSLYVIFLCKSYFKVKVKMLGKIKYSQALLQTLKFHKECSFWMVISLGSHSITNEILEMTANLTCFFLSLNSLVISLFFPLFPPLPCSYKTQSPQRYGWLFQMSRQTLYTFLALYSSSLNLGGSKKSRQGRSG